MGCAGHGQGGRGWGYNSTLNPPTNPAGLPTEDRGAATSFRVSRGRDSREMGKERMRFLIEQHFPDEHGDHRPKGACCAGNLPEKSLDAGGS